MGCQGSFYFESLYLCTFRGWPVHETVLSVAVAPSLVCHWSVGLGHACPERDLRAVCSVQRAAACRCCQCEGLRLSKNAIATIGYRQEQRTTPLHVIRP